MANLPQKDVGFHAADLACLAVLRLRPSPELELRVLTEADAPVLYALVEANRAHLARWLPWASGETLDDARRFVQDGLRRLDAVDGFEMGIHHDGRLVGVIGLHGIHPVNLSTSLGYWLAADAEGKGLARAACRAVLGHCFDTLRLHRVEIRVAPDNDRSLAIPRALGFREEGRLREVERMGDGWMDLVVFSLLETEWRQR